MVVRKRKKSSRMRGSHTHGWGSKKKHRGSGNRGGFGMAGTGKRADHRKTQIWDDPKYFGKYGFTPLKKIKREGKLKGKVLNIDDLGGLSGLKEIQDTGKEAQMHQKKPAMVEVDLSRLGIAKLLGRGVVKEKLKIKVHAASAQAREKVHAAGGMIVTDAMEVMDAKDIMKVKGGSKQNKQDGNAEDNPQ